MPDAHRAGKLEVSASRASLPIKEQSLSEVDFIPANIFIKKKQGQPVGSPLLKTQNEQPLYLK